MSYSMTAKPVVRECLGPSTSYYCCDLLRALRAERRASRSRESWCHPRHMPALPMRRKSFIL